MSLTLPLNNDSNGWLEILKNRIFTKLNTFVDPIINNLEELHPWHPFGKNKKVHMERLANDVLEFSQWLELNKREVFLLEIILRCHDIGRHAEGLWKETHIWEEIKNHSQYAADFLKNNNILEWLDESEKEVIYEAIRYHGVGKVEIKDATSLAYKLCYKLRDHDKMDALQDMKYMQPDGILAQLWIRFLSWEDSKLLKEKTADHSIHSYLHNVVASSLGGPKNNYKRDDIFEATRGIKNVVDKIIVKLDSPVLPKTLDNFLTKRLCDQEFKQSDSYSTYMLYTLAFMYDLKYDISLEEAITDPAIIARLNFLKYKEGEESFIKIISTLKEYLLSRWTKNQEIREQSINALLLNFQNA